MEDIRNARCCVDGCELRASYPDVHGTPRSLCSFHAEQAGTHIRAPLGCGASVVAMQCFDRVEKLLKIEIHWRIRINARSEDGGVTYKSHVEGSE